MTNAEKTQKELSAIRAILVSAINATDREEYSTLMQKALRRVDLLTERAVKAPIEQGRKGGKKTAERGPEYYKQIAAMRKTRGGGRPKKQPESKT